METFLQDFLVIVNHLEMGNLEDNVRIGICSSSTNSSSSSLTDVCNEETFLSDFQSDCSPVLHA